MDDALYTFETLLHQELGKLQGKDELCKSIQRILERVLKVRAGAVPMPQGFWDEEDSKDPHSGCQKFFGKCFLLLRLSCLLLRSGASEWWRRWRTQPHVKACVGPRESHSGFGMTQTLL